MSEWSQPSFCVAIDTPKHRYAIMMMIPIWSHHHHQSLLLSTKKRQWTNEQRSRFNLRDKYSTKFIEVCHSIQSNDDDDDNDNGLWTVILLESINSVYVLITASSFEFCTRFITNIAITLIVIMMMMSMVVDFFRFNSHHHLLLLFRKPWNEINVSDT